MDIRFLLEIGGWHLQTADYGLIIFWNFPKFSHLPAIKAEKPLCRLPILFQNRAGMRQLAQRCWAAQDPNRNLLSILASPISPTNGERIRKGIVINYQWDYLEAMKA